MSTPGTGVIPPLGKARPLRIPPVEEATLSNGLRVVAARRASVPRVEIKLLVPAGAAFDAAAGGASARLAAEMISGGTDVRSSDELAEDLQRLGADLAGAVRHDHLWVVAGGLKAGLKPLLGLTAEAVSRMLAPEDELAIARDAALREIADERATPGYLASEMLAARLLGGHPYAKLLPEPDEYREATGARVRAFMRRRAVPKGSTLVLVGDVAPAKAIVAAEEAFAGWTRNGNAGRLPKVRVESSVPTVLIHRPGSVQATIAIGGRAPRRTDPGYPAAYLANVVFGGYFSSRLVENIRENKGYTYSPHSRIAERRGVALLDISADVRNDVAAASMTEIRYELSRMCSLPVEPEELEAARRYVLGIQALSMGSQAGLAAQLATVEALDAPMTFLKDFRAAIARVTAEEVLEASRSLFAPSRLQTVIVGDVDAIAPGLEALSPLDIVRSPRKRR